MCDLAMGREIEDPRVRPEWCPLAEAEAAANKRYLATIQNQRERDLLRQCRGHLLDEGLISEDEYAALVAESGAVGRLEDYDAVRAELASTVKDRRSDGEELGRLRRDLAALLAKAAAADKERDNWMETARRCQVDADYFRGLVVQVGEMLGPAPKTCDDGGIVPDVLCAKVPELVEEVVKGRDSAREYAERLLRHAAPSAAPLADLYGLLTQLDDWIAGTIAELSAAQGLPTSTATKLCTSEESDHPKACPITGRPFFMVVEHPERGSVATYGGPLDSYTIPEVDDDGQLRVERYDHDRGEWIEGGEPEQLFVVPEDEYNELLSARSEREAARAHECGLREALIEWRKHHPKCPTCGSPNPKKHPAAQFEGEVQICSDPWHATSPEPPCPHERQRDELAAALEEIGAIACGDTADGDFEQRLRRICGIVDAAQSEDILAARDARLKSEGAAEELERISRENRERASEPGGEPLISRSTLEARAAERREEARRG
jgi:hypothetical protein